MAKIAVVGAGYWGPNLVRAFAAQRATTELMVCDSDTARLEWIGSRFPRAKLVSEYDAVLNSDVDGIVLATPVTTHYELARKALDAGKHILVEKPLTASVEEARRLVDLSERVGRHLMVGHDARVLATSHQDWRDSASRRPGQNLLRVVAAREPRRIAPEHQRRLGAFAPHDLSVLFELARRGPRSPSQRSAKTTRTAASPMSPSSRWSSRAVSSPTSK